MIDVMIPDEIQERQRLVRAAFIGKGTSLRAWSIANGIAPQNAHKALSNQWTGPKAAQVVSDILKAAGISE